jgi:hypothetical protein
MNNGGIWLYGIKLLAKQYVVRDFGRKGMTCCTGSTSLDLKNNYVLATI